MQTGRVAPILVGPRRQQRLAWRAVDCTMARFLGPHSLGVLYQSETVWSARCDRGELLTTKRKRLMVPARQRVLAE